MKSIWNPKLIKIEIYMILIDFINLFIENVHKVNLLFIKEEIYDSLSI